MKYLLYKDGKGFAKYNPADGSISHTLDYLNADEACLSDWSDVLGLDFGDYRQILRAADIEKLRCTTDRICGAHIGAVDVHLTGNFALGCPCCQRDCAQISLQGYTVAEPANDELKHRRE